jgi:hypothetical protein
MIRPVSTLLAVSAFGFVMATMGCTPVVCGPGTKQMQKANGDIECLPADQVATGDQPCDVDGGTAQIVGGVCVSRIICDPATAKYDPATGVCVGTGGGAGCSEQCPSTVGPSQICVQGRVIDFMTGMPVMKGGRPLRIAAFEPLSFIGNPTGATPLKEDPANTEGCFALTMGAPASGLVAIGVTDPTTGPGNNPPLAMGGSGAPIVGGQIYRLDAYMMLKSTMADWSTVTGLDFTGKGAVIECFYSDPGQPPTDLEAKETMPAMGVTLLEDGATPASARYLDNNRKVVTTATTTTSFGCAIALGDAQVHNFSGTGGGVTKWETQPGGSPTGVGFVGRYHNCDVSTGDPACQ